MSSYNPFGPKKATAPSPSAADAWAHCCCVDCNLVYSMVQEAPRIYCAQTLRFVEPCPQCRKKKNGK